MKFKKIALGVVLTLGLGYGLTVFTEIPYLSEMRNIWIETAMTTGEHQWLATSFIPKFVIDKVMKNKVGNTDIISVTEIQEPTVKVGMAIEDGTEKFPTHNLFGETGKVQNNSEAKPLQTDILNQKNLGDTDSFGNKVLVNDKEQGIVIVEVKSLTYSGQLVLIDDPSRVFVADTNKKGEMGELILDYIGENNAVLGINANGFDDKDGVGNGGNILGCSLAEGIEWGKAPKEETTTVGFDTSNRLVVGNIKDWDKYKLRDAAQFGPLLISNGKTLVDGSAGWGVQPRTIVGQRADGVVAFLIVDGRQPGHSIGITFGEANKVLQQYGIVNAAGCDGGSSTVLAYNDKIINRPSTPMKTGRYLPNALLVRKK